MALIFSSIHLLDCGTPVDWKANQKEISETYDSAEKNLEINTSDTALIVAAKNNHSDTVTILLNYHADVNITGTGDYSALILAAENNLSDIAEILLDYQTDVDLLLG